MNSDWASFFLSPRARYKNLPSSRELDYAIPTKLEQKENLQYTVVIEQILFIINVFIDPFANPNTLGLQEKECGKLKVI